MAAEDRTEEKSGTSWGKIALGGTLAIGGALVGYAAFSPEIASTLQGLTKDSTGIFDSLGNKVASSGESLREGMAKLANGIYTSESGAYKANDFTSILGTDARPEVIPNPYNQGSAAIDATKGFTGVVADVVSNRPIATTATVAGVGAAAYGAKKWADRVGGPRAQNASRVAQLEAERAQGPGSLGRA